MENGTPIKRLCGLEFFVYLYALKEPRHYVGLTTPNTIGFGYYGKDECIQEGLERIAKQTSWLRENINRLKSELGTRFADAAQYIVLARFETDFSMTVGTQLMSREECEEYIRNNLLL